MMTAICVGTVIVWAISLVVAFSRGEERGYETGFNEARIRNGADAVRRNRQRQREAEDLAKSVAAMRRKARQDMAAN